MRSRRARSSRQPVGLRKPNTARMITSRVTDCIRGRSENGSPAGQRLTSSSATSVISAS